MWFVNLCNLQNASCNSEIVIAQFTNFWPKPDPNPNRNPNPNPNADSNPSPNPGQIVQCILQIVQTHKLHATVVLVMILCDNSR